MKTTWKPVVGFEGLYEVNDIGQIWSHRRGRLLKASRGKHPYLRVWLMSDGARICRLVHSIVAEAFIGPRPAGEVVRHLNDIKTDNRVANLTYGTHSENQIDAILNGGRLIVVTEDDAEIPATASIERRDDKWLVRYRSEGKSRSRTFFSHAEARKWKNLLLTAGTKEANKHLTHQRLLVALPQGLGFSVG